MYSLYWFNKDFNQSLLLLSFFTSSTRSFIKQIMKEKYWFPEFLNQYISTGKSCWQSYH